MPPSDSPRAELHAAPHQAHDRDSGERQAALIDQGLAASGRLSSYVHSISSRNHTHQLSPLTHCHPHPEAPIASIYVIPDHSDKWAAA